MADTFRADDYDTYRMDYGNPHRELEPLEDEVAVVDEALAALKAAGVLPHTSYDHEKMLAHRQAVRDAALAFTLGTTMPMEAFGVAFRIPNLLRRLFSEGALSAAFIPVPFPINRTARSISAPWKKQSDRIIFTSQGHA